LSSIGHISLFVVTAIVSIGHARRHYRRETPRLIAEIGMGTGAMAVIGATIAIVGFVTLSGGSLIAIQGFASLGPARETGTKDAHDHLATRTESRTGNFELPALNSMRRTAPPSRPHGRYATRT
jgi:hypothetical protein